ncbi:hypothetical protein DERF_004276 [Dermatophagoides farinae]|uniref:Uncharacterized protein n=1 Tax=Dermatophagoides farinae TaxID=6954 RepID=A0A922I4H0_DERFA|nr:hypothetical protein DERF_004276 [Dermatophagoides farinae]
MSFFSLVRCINDHWISAGVAAAPPPTWYPVKGVNFSALCLTVVFHARRVTSGFRFGTAGSAMNCTLHF